MAAIAGANKWWIVAVIAGIIFTRKIGYWMIKITNADYSPITLYGGKLTARISDNGGKGHFGANRSRPGGTVGKHQGRDILCTPGNDVMAPYGGTIQQLSVPYKDDPRYSGVWLRVNAALLIKIMYMQPKPGIVGKKVVAGEVLGICQNISVKYGPNVPPHLHVEVHEWDVPVDPDPYIFKS